MPKRFIVQPNAAFRLGDFLGKNLRRADWKRFRAAIAFVKRSGVKHVKKDLAAFAGRAEVRISVGVDLGGTSQEGLEDLLAAAGSNGEIYIVHNEQESTFHPKIYLFANDASAIVAIGSGNLTQGGLFTNYESMLELQLNLANADDLGALQQVEAAMDEWTNTEAATVRRLDSPLLQALIAQGYVKTEARTITDEPVERPHPAGAPPAPPLFPRVAVKRAPPVAGEALPAVPAPLIQPFVAPAAPPSNQVQTQASAAAFEGFVMTLMQTDAGHGQTTPNRQRRSPEIFIPLAARDHAKEFWGWPEEFEETPTKWDRTGLKFRVGTQVVPVNMMVWKAKRDLRLRSEALRSAGSVGDILKLVKTDPAVVGYSYDAEIIKKGSPAFESYMALCTNEVRNSQKRWGQY